MIDCDTIKIKYNTFFYHIIVSVKINHERIQMTLFMMKTDINNNFMKLDANVSIKVFLKKVYMINLENLCIYFNIYYA